MFSDDFIFNLVMGEFRRKLREKPTLERERYRGINFIDQIIEMGFYKFFGRGVRRSGRVSCIRAAINLFARNGSREINSLGGELCKISKFVA